MPAGRIAMVKLKELLRLKFDCKLSHRQIARALGISKAAVGKYVVLAQQASIDWAVACAQIFVAALGASNYSFACATWTQTTADWLAALAKALAFIGGVTELIVPDNTRALIGDANRYEPMPNRSACEFAAHYSTVILPARPYRPRDKAKVEFAVQLVERWVLARLRPRQVFSLGGL